MVMFTHTTDPDALREFAAMFRGMAGTFAGIADEADAAAEAAAARTPVADALAAVQAAHAEDTRRRAAVLAFAGAEQDPTHTTTTEPTKESHA